MRLLTAIIMAAMLLIGGMAALHTPVSAQGDGTHREVLLVTNAGTAGAAAGSKASSNIIAGYIRAVYVDYGSSISTTTDMTLTTTAPLLTFLTLTNIYTDGWYYPTVQYHDLSGAVRTTYGLPPVNDLIYANVSQSSAGQVVTVTVLWGE